MKEEYYSIFFNALLQSTREISNKYFELPVAYAKEIVFRERAYCYELYHQIRKVLPVDFPYVLSGEVNKAGHPLIAPYCGSIIPDFLIHNPGHMEQDDNLIIVEVKTIQGADFSKEREGLLKDIDVLKCMTELENGYYMGIILIFGSGYIERKEEIKRIYTQRCNPQKIKLLFHDNALEEAILFNVEL